MCLFIFFSFQYRRRVISVFYFFFFALLKYRWLTVLPVAASSLWLGGGGDHWTATVVCARARARARLFFVLLLRSRTIETCPDLRELVTIGLCERTHEVYTISVVVVASSVRACAFCFCCRYILVDYAAGSREFFIVSRFTSSDVHCCRRRYYCRCFSFNMVNRYVFFLFFFLPFAFRRTDRVTRRAGNNVNERTIFRIIYYLKIK